MTTYIFKKYKTINYMKGGKRSKLLIIMKSLA